MSINTTSTMAETSVKVIKYSGKRQDWIPWMTQHLARATMRGHRGILDGTVLVPTKTVAAGLDATDPIEALELKKLMLNVDAYSDLVLSMAYGTPQGNIAFDIVRQSVSDEYPDGNAREAFMKLKRKYQPETAPELARLHKLFFGTKHKKRQDPEIYISYLEDFRLRMSDMKSIITDIISSYYIS